MSKSATLAQESDTSFPPLVGFEHIQCFSDKKYNICGYRIMPGEYTVANNKAWIHTLLGSCVSACLRDPKTGIGGVNHFLLPDVSCPSHDSGHYGLNAMELLINAIMNYGGQRNRLVAKIFGGASVIQGVSINVGYKNASFIKHFLETERIPIEAEDIGGERARNIYFQPASGKVYVRYAGKHTSEVFADTENSYFNKVKKEEPESTISYFD